MYKEYPSMVSVYVKDWATENKYIAFADVHLGSKCRRELISFHPDVRYHGKKYNYLGLPRLGIKTIQVDNSFSIVHLKGNTIKYLEKHRHRKFYIYRRNK